MEWFPSSKRNLFALSALCSSDGLSPVLLSRGNPSVSPLCCLFPDEEEDAAPGRAEEPRTASQDSGHHGTGTGAEPPGVAGLGGVPFLAAPKALTQLPQSGLLRAGCLLAAKLLEPHLGCAKTT